MIARVRPEVDMVFGASIALAGVLCVGLIGCSTAYAECPVDTVILKGRVEHATRGAKVRVQLVYPQGVPGESGEASVDDGTFRIPIEFLTLSKRPLLRNLPEKCDRKPRAVNVTLMEGDQESKSLSLDLVRDFKLADPSAYALRSELVLEGQH
jgi:hypothetical protein